MKKWFKCLRLEVAGGFHRPLAGGEGGAAGLSQRLLPPTQGRWAAWQGRAAFALALVCFFALASSSLGFTRFPFYDDFAYADGTSLVDQQGWSVFTQGPGYGILTDDYHGWVGYPGGYAIASNSLARLTGRALFNRFGDYTRQPGIGPPKSSGAYDKPTLVTVRYMLDLSEASAPDDEPRTMSRIGTMFWHGYRWHYENRGRNHIMLPVVRFFVKDDGLVSAYFGNQLHHLTHTAITGSTPVTVVIDYVARRWSLWIGDEQVVNTRGLYKTHFATGEFDHAHMAHDGWYKDYDGLKEVGFADNTTNGVTLLDRVRVFEGLPSARAMPLIENFETREVYGETVTMELGNLNGQNAWFANGAEIAAAAQNTELGGAGVQGGRIGAGGEAFQLFLDGQTNVWSDFWMKPVASGSGTANVDAGGGHAVFYVNDAGEVHAYDGATTTNVASVTAGDWSRFTVHSDYATRTWKLYVGGTLVYSDLAFQGNGHGDTYEELRFWSAGTAVIYIDDMVVHTEDPFNNPTVSFATDSVEIGTGVTQVTLTASLSWAFGQPITVAYSLQSDGTAMQVYGYNVADGTFVFMPGETAKSVTFTINRDTFHYAEHDDTLVFALTNVTSNVAIGDHDQLTYTIRTDPAHLHVIPFSESFEHRSLGLLDGQRGWQAKYFAVQADDAFGGSQAARSTRLGASLTHTFSNEPRNVTVQWRAKVPLARNAPTPPAGSTYAFYVDADGHIVAFDGTTATNMGAVVVLNPSTWAHFRVDANYNTRQWTLFVNSTRVLQDFTFYDDDAPEYFHAFEGHGQFTIDDIMIDYGPPATPTNLVAAASEGEIALSWSPAQGAVTYRLKRGTNLGGPYSLLASLTGTSFTDTSVLNNITYYYVVSAMNAMGEGNPSAEAQATTRDKVTGLEGIAGIGRITLHWDAYAGATNYNILRGTQAGGSYALLVTSEVNSLVDSNVVNGVTYYYRVTADTDSYTSLPSDEISASPALRTIFYDSFEEPVVEGMIETAIPNWHRGIVPGTTGSTDIRVGLWNEDSGSMTTPYGEQAAYLWRDRYIQTTSIEETAEAGAFYLVTFNVAVQWGEQEGDDYNVRYYAALMAGSTILSDVTAGWPIGEGNFERADSIAFTVPEDHMAIGEPLGIRIEFNSGQWERRMGVDNVRLRASIDPPPVLPDPLTFSVAPSADSKTAISMTAESVTNGVGPILYRFENVTTGENSGWSDSISWTDTGLSPGTIYGYRVKASDVYGNENLWSTVSYAETFGANVMTNDAGADSWNNGDNWSNLAPPYGEESPRIAAGVVAVVGSAPSNTYQGNLILDTGSSLEFASAATAAVLPGSGYQIQLHAGSVLRALATVDVGAALVMLGDAEVLAGSGSNAVNFNGAISGSGQLTLAGHTGNEFHFNTANTLTGGITTTNAANGGHSVFANVNNALGTGDVTINDYASLHRFGGLSSTIANTATLRLNGEKDPAAAAKVIISGNETVFQLYVDGVVQPRGSHGSPESTAQHKSATFSGSGLLWVTVGDDDIYALSTRNITESSAVLEGKLDVPFSSRVARVYWSTNNNADASEWLADAAASSAVVGTYSQKVGQGLVHGLIDLEENTPHYFTFSASNDVDVIWGDTATFLTVGAPELVNLGVAATGDGNATLAGMLTAGSVADTTFVLGTSDMGTVSIFDWDRRFSMGLVNQDQTITHVAGNLIYGVPYFYRLHAENVIGTGWSDVETFLSAIPHSGDTILVGVAGADVTDVTETSVTLHGTLDAPRSIFTVHAYWSTNDYATAAEWQADGAAQTAEIGTYQNVNGFTVSQPISDLEEATTYYYTFRITNPATNIWAEVNREFGTKGPPTVGTADGAVDLGYGTATLQGKLLTGGVVDAWFAWDEEDAGTTSTGDWANVISMGEQLQSIVFAEELSGLVYGVEYFYRAHVTNEYGNVWSSNAVAFTSGIPMDEENNVLVGITNASASDIAGTTATMHGVLDATQSVFTVTAYWDTTNHGTNLPAWVDNATQHEVGSFTNVMNQAVSVELTGLTQDQPYYFTFVAANAATNLLAFPQGQFATEGPPAVSTAAGVTNVGVGSADLQAELTAGGIADAWLVWGLEDAEAGELADWEHEAEIGQVLQYNIFSASVSNLLYGATYFYRAYVTNSINVAWSDAAGTFTTLPPDGLGIQNTNVTDIELTQATFQGSLDATQSVFTVHVFVSTNLHATAEAWRVDGDARNVMGGTYTNVVGQAFDVQVTGLSAGTTYYYTFMASNVVGEIWAAPAVEFSTQDYPIPVASGALPDISKASLQGEITRFNGVMTDVQIYFGTSDGGTNPGAWDTNFVFSVESIVEGATFAETATGLVYGVEYTYRVYAANDFGAAWSAPASFTTQPPTKRNAELRVDFNRAGSVNQQSDWQAFSDGETDGSFPNPSSRSYASSMATDDDLTVMIGGMTHWRRNNAVTGTFADLSDLLRDGPIVAGNVTSTITLTLRDLSAGLYEIILYNHRTEFGGGTLTMTLTDAMVTDAQKFQGVTTTGTSPTSITTNAFQFVSDGSDVIIKMAKSGSSSIMFNGFELYEILEAVEVAATEATNITANAADLNGTLDTPHAGFLVTAYWSTNDYQTVQAWQDGEKGSQVVGAFTNVLDQALSANVAGLTEATTYYYTFMLANDATNIWATPNASFRTQGTPEVDHAGGAADVTAVSATLRGILTEGGVASAYFVWGDAEPASPDVLENWGAQVPMGLVQQDQIFDHAIEGLAASTIYYYRVYVTNDVSAAWSAVTNFTTPILVNVMTDNAGSADSWNTAANWSYGHVPLGLDQAVINTNVAAQVDHAATPSYAGPLTLKAGSSLQVNATAGSENALGGDLITLHTNAAIRLRNATEFDLTNDIHFAGDALIDRHTDNQTTYLSGVISGDGQFTYSARRGGVLYLTGANSNTWAGGFVVTNADYVDSNRVLVKAHKTGAFGGGDVTINDGVSLVVSNGLAGTMSSNAVLALNGRPHNANAKLVLESDETVYQLWFDGVQQPGGTYTSSADWLDGSNTLTVLDWPVLLTNTSAQDVQPETADLEGAIDIVNETFDVLVYWSTNNHADADAWLTDAAASNMFVGTYTSASGVTGAVEHLVSKTVYYYTLRATNAYADVWAEPNIMFVTPGPPGIPAVTTAGGATGIGANDATLHGVLTEGGSADATIVWGTSDGGTNSTSDWTNPLPIGPVIETFVFSTEISGLLYGPEYFYRVYATNSFGVAWSEAESITTQLPAGVGIVNQAVANRRSSAADLHATLDAPESIFTVTAFWSTNDYATTAEWEAAAGTAELGTFSNVVDYAVSVTASGLEASTPYFYTFRAANGLTNLWSGNAQFETTPIAPPVVGVAGGAVPGKGQATLQGVVSNFNGIVSDVRVYLGTSDGGTNPVAWDTNYVVNASSIVEGVTFSTNVTGLLYGVPYFYRVFAENEHGGAWSTVTNFVTLLPTKVSADLRVDFNREGSVSQQSGWAAFTAPDATAPVEKTYATPLAISNDVTVRIEGMTHWRQYNAISGGDYVPLSSLLRDGPIRSSTGTMTLTLRDLAPGEYEIITYHHCAQFGGGTLTLTLTDAEVTNAQKFQGVTSGGTSPTSITSNAFPFVSDGSDVLIKMARSGNGNIMFNGFELFQIVDAVGITATEAANVMDTAADLQGVLEGTQSVFTVTAYWSTNDHATAETWLADDDKGSALVGTFTNVVEHPLMVTATGLVTETTYYYTFVATNVMTHLWSSTNVQFVTRAAPSQPAISLDGGASDVGVGTAMLHGVLTEGVVAAATFVWDTSDGGTNRPSDWANPIPMGAVDQGSAFSNAVSGLLYGPQYAYRVYATNAAGDAWSELDTFFTLPPEGEDAPAITNIAATNITMTTADLVGHLNATGAIFDVTLYWSVSNNLTSADWLADNTASNIVVGTYTNVSGLSVTGAVDNLISGGVYSYTFVATNAATNIWASPTATFGTHGIPSVNLAGGADPIGGGAATLNGRVVSDGGSVLTDVVIHLGTADGGTDAGNWEQSLVFDAGTIEVGQPFSTNKTGLIFGKTYYYRVFAANTYGPAWSDATSFTPLLPLASGGTITNTYTDAEGTWIAHIFHEDADFVMPAGLEVEYLVVAGGGGGGRTRGGGGGAGGFRTGTTNLLADTYGIVVGTGGLGASSDTGFGHDSSFASIVAAGGGRGGRHASATGSPGQDGGSGGGGGGGATDERPAGNGIAGQGNAGGTGTSNAHGGGGGGAGTTGNHASADSAGGDGKPSAITGTNTWYAGGGGGMRDGASGDASAPGGQGGGGQGASTLGGTNNRTSGEPRTGGGGGGGNNASGATGGDGGSGIVVVRYLIPNLIAAETATDIEPDSATLHGSIYAPQSVFTVKAYWSTNDNADAAAWDVDGTKDSVEIGTFTNVLDHTLVGYATGLAPDTTYYYRFMATNAVTNIWSPTNRSFTTPATATQPAVGIGIGADPVGVGTATVNGVLTDGKFADAYFVWGTADASTTSTSDWQQVVAMGHVLEGDPFSTNLTSLIYGQQYYYRVYVTNDVGEAWSEVVDFMTEHAGAPAMAAGGSMTNIYVDAEGAWVTHIFHADGAFVAPAETEVEYLVVAGGGAGGRVRGGGGGAGGFLSGSTNLVAGTNTVVVGAGGLAGSGDGNGFNSSFGSIETIGGGAGGRHRDLDVNGQAGGSGGGGGSFAGHTAGLGTAGQGNAGGGGNSSAGDAGGGGGAGASGRAHNAGTTPSAGGVGKESAITGTNTWYAGGGAGMRDGGARALGGQGGGGDGANGSSEGGAKAGAANSGGGGGGGGNAGGSGGSGIVAVRYRLPLEIAVKAATDVALTSATLNGVLHAFEAVFALTAYVSTNANTTVQQWLEDAQKTPVALGSFTNAVNQAFDVSLISLQSGTTYYYTFFATNLATNVWADGTASFETAPPPVIVAYSPAQDAEDVLPTILPTASFDKAIDLVDAAGVTLTNLTANLDTAMSVSVSGGTNLVVTPDAVLLTGDAYAVLIAPGAVGGFGGITATNTWTFTIIEAGTEPLVTTQSPTNTATDVAVDIDLVITFNQKVLAGAGNIELWEDGGGAAVQTIAVTNASVTVESNTVTIALATLDPSTVYDVVIPAGAFTDVSTLYEFAGIAQGAWTLTTGAFEAPTVTTAAGTTNIGIGVATLAGAVTHDGNVGIDEVAIYLGASDGGETPGNWDTNFVFALADITINVPFSTNVTALLYGQRYYYRVFAANSEGGAWSAPETFVTERPVTEAAMASGGNVTNIYSDAEGTWAAHVFLTGGDFVVPSELDVEYLVVAGGGGGGGSTDGSTAGGGGGAGGLLTGSTNLAASVSSYSVTVGGGGSGGNGGTTGATTTGAPGTDSAAFGITAFGGGYGGRYDSGGGDGGSGGGAGQRGGDGGEAGGTALEGGIQGNNGGSRSVNGNYGAASGGGAGGPGVNNTTSINGRDGGLGVVNRFAIGLEIVYAAGGGGGAHTGVGGDSQTGGKGGDSATNGSNADANTGGGGGGASVTRKKGGAGGSGIVVVRYSYPVRVTAAAATAVVDDSATLNGILDAQQSVFDVVAYWSTSSNATLQAWQDDNTKSNAFVGTFTNVMDQALTVSVTGLAAEASYYYTFVATNAVTNLWASPTVEFVTTATPVQPAVTLNGGVSDVGVGSATLHGLLTEGAVAAATFVWDTSDGGTNSISDWNNQILLGMVAEAVAFSNEVSGLLYGPQYAYRVYVTNDAGDAWSALDTFFTLPPEGALAPAITNIAATNITETTAALVGQLDATDAIFDVTLYWSESNNLASADWLADNTASNLVLGTYTNVSGLSITGAVENLTSSTLYYYTYLASNPATNIWASPTAAFGTRGVPAVDVAGGASSIGVGTATLNGRIISDGGTALDHVRIYFGTSDGGENTGTWDQDFAFDLGTIEVGQTFSTNLTDLIYGASYYYRVFAENAYGSAWSGVESFHTEAVAWTPEGLAAVAAWYDAMDTATVGLSGSTVTNWLDKSGNDNHGIGNNSVDYIAGDSILGGRPSIGRTGSTSGDHGIKLPSLGAKHLYVIAYFDDGSTSTLGNLYRSLFTGDDSASNYRYRVMTQNNSANWLASSHFNDLWTYRNGATESSLVALPMPATLWKFKAVASRTQGRQLGYYPGQTRDWPGRYSEWIFTDGNEGADTEAKIEGYLAHKWGLAGNLRADHPYKTAAPTGGMSVANTSATNVTATAADLQGTLDATQSVFTVTAYWSTNNHATLEAWQADGLKGVAAVGTFTNVVGQALSVPATGLTVGTTNYYTFVASNAVTTIWSGSNTLFETLANLELVARSPSHGANEVAITVAPSMTFAQPVQKGIGTIEIRVAGDNTLVETIDVTSAQVSISDATATITLSQDLAYSTAYNVVVSGGAFEAAGGGVSVEIPNGEWQFTTREAPGDSDGSVFRFR